MNRWTPLTRALAGLCFLLAAPLAASAETRGDRSGLAADNSAALALFRAGRYAAAYAAFWPALKQGDPEAVFHSLIIRRHGLDGRAPAKGSETDALTSLLAGRAGFMRMALQDSKLPENTADAYRTALAQLVYMGQIQLDDPPSNPADLPARQRKEALALISSLWPGAPADRYPPAQNFAAHLNLASGEAAKRSRALLLKSAEAGDPLGMINFSLFCRAGLGGPRNDLQAVHWARRAADSEPPMARALNEVGYYYEIGRGVTRDLTEARAWYAKSAARGYQPGRSNAARFKSVQADELPQGRPVLDETVMF